jgi:hypothetical protein
VNAHHVIPNGVRAAFYAALCHLQERQGSNLPSPRSSLPRERITDETYLSQSKQLHVVLRIPGHHADGVLCRHHFLDQPRCRIWNYAAKSGGGPAPMLDDSFGTNEH